MSPSFPGCRAERLRIVRRVMPAKLPLSSRYFQRPARCVHAAPPGSATSSKPLSLTRTPFVGGSMATHGVGMTAAPLAVSFVFRAMLFAVRCDGVTVIPLLHPRIFAGVGIGVGVGVG